jgi:hypothetical protein
MSLHFAPMPNNGFKVWLAGVHKIISYHKGEFYAYYLSNGDKNFGVRVGNPQKSSRVGSLCWPTLTAAKQACNEHALTYSPTPATKNRAAEIKAHFQLPREHTT